MTAMTEPGSLLRDRVGDELRERIADGRLAAGTRLVERDLADLLNVSRVPVREAIRMLQTEGFVDVQERRGAVVKALSSSDVEDLFDVREAIETMAVRRAAKVATPESIAEVAELLEHSRRALENGDTVGVHVTNSAFHGAVVDLAGNDLIRGLLSPISLRLRWLSAQNNDPERVWKEHSAILTAIESGNADRAAVLVAEHTNASRKMTLRMLDS